MQYTVGDEEAREAGGAEQGGVQGGQWETSTRIITGEEKRGFLREGGGTVFLCGNKRQCSESLLEVLLKSERRGFSSGCQRCCLLSQTAKHGYFHFAQKPANI